MMFFYIALVVSVLALVWAGIAIYLRVRRHMNESGGEAARRQGTGTGSSRDQRP